MPEIPVPPFTGHDDARRFHQLLMLHLSQLKRPGEPVGVHQFLLGQVLAPHEPRGDAGTSCAECERPYPCRTVLRVALVSRFGADWSPLGLVRLLRDTRIWGARFDEVELGEEGFAWEFEPRFTAERRPGGGWVVTSTERGSSRVRAEPADDRAMVEFIADQVRERPFPFGWRVPEEFPAMVADGARAAAGWWSEHGRLPYLSRHDESGSW
ncbi:hypothetical protein V6U90_25285 [Micromonospora sp. CPCC 206060]|uniref:hypothetical protein n=1 Tax=Micromonospora sp. CPCC 206060 TaxID=3122406 RepID=UPI002FF29E38